MNTPLINTNQPTQMKAPQIDIKMTEEVLCDKCKGRAFQDAVVLRRVSAILSGTGKAGFMPISTMVCLCGHINEEFLPSELRTPKIT